MKNKNHHNEISWWMNKYIKTLITVHTTPNNIISMEPTFSDEKPTYITNGKPYPWQTFENLNRHATCGMALCVIIVLIVTNILYKISLK